MSTRPHGCPWCEALAHTGRHEQYLVDDADARLRLWRCSACAVLWCVSERAVVPVGPEEADRVLPQWRDQERWIVCTPLPGILEAAAAGTVGPDLVAVALMHHDVLVGPGTPRGVGYSTPATAALDGLDPDALRAVRVPRWMSRVPTAVVDPAGPHTCVMTFWQQWHLDHADGRPDLR